MPRGRPKGSKNKKKLSIAVDLNGKADYFAKKFIANEGIDVAEELAEKILSKISESKRRIAQSEKINSLY